jgi:hypothetical protein
MHKALLIAAAVAGLALSAPALAQAPAPALQLPNQPAVRPGLTQQLDDLSARIDRDLAQGRISQADAIRDHREVNRIQDLAAADREANAGHLTEAEHFDLQAQIDQLGHEIHQQHTGADAGAAN